MLHCTKPMPTKLGLIDRRFKEILLHCTNYFAAPPSARCGCTLFKHVPALTIHLPVAETFGRNSDGSGLKAAQ